MEKKKIIVISDSHGRSGKVKKIIAAHRDANGIIYLGDGERDLELALAENGLVCYAEEAYLMEGGGADLSGKQTVQKQTLVYQVRGNCDRDSRQAVTLIREIGGLRFYLTHGFEQGVKYGLQKLAQLAKAESCSVALFGHTHGVYHSRLDGIALFNPGSAADGNYGIITVSHGSVKLEHFSLQPGKPG